MKDGLLGALRHRGVQDEEWPASRWVIFPFLFFEYSVYINLISPVNSPQLTAESGAGLTPGFIPLIGYSLNLIG